MKISASDVHGSTESSPTLHFPETAQGNGQSTVARKNYTTKLSLPKFMAVAKSLNPIQKELVRSIGLHHLLDLSCSAIPKSIILWLVDHFNPLTLTFNLPNGHSFTIHPENIHQVLGVPIGGRSLPKLCTEDLKKLICSDTNCAGKYPTINELKDLITEDLSGHKFIRIFTLFALTALLCPCSSECASPEFFPIIENPDNIISFDWSTIVFDKLVTSIAKYQEATNVCTTASLGGCTFAMMVVYFELLDFSELNLPASLPRISLWSNENITTVINADKLNEERIMFGAVPLRDMNSTALRRRTPTEHILIDTSRDITQQLLSILPGEAFSKAREHLKLLYIEQWKEFIKATRPFLVSQITRTASILKESHCSKFNKQCSILGKGSESSKDDTIISNSIFDKMPPPKVSFDHHGGQGMCEILFQHLQPMDLWEGFDTAIQGDNFFAELEKNLFHNLQPMGLLEGYGTGTQGHNFFADLEKKLYLDDTENAIAPVDEVNLHELTLSIANLPISYEGIIKEAYMHDYYAFPEARFLQDIEMQCPTSNIPLKKRPLPASFSEKPSQPIYENLKTSGTPNTAPSLNELALQRVAAARKKRLKYQVPTPNQEVIQRSSTNLIHHSNPSCPVNRSSPPKAHSDVPSIKPADAELGIQLQFHTPLPGNQRRTNTFNQTEVATMRTSPESLCRTNTLNQTEATTMKTSPESFRLQNTMSSQGNQNCSSPDQQGQIHYPDHNTVQFNDFFEWDEDVVRQLDESVATAINTQQTPEQIKIPMKPAIFYHAFASTSVERAVHQYIVSTIPAPFPARSPKVVKIAKKNWVDHRTFGLSMQVHGSVSHNVINIMGAAIMEAQYTKHIHGLLSRDEWGKFILHYDLSRLLQDDQLDPTDVAPYVSEKMIGFRLDNADLVFVPVRKSSYWYIVVANFRDKRFEIICPFQDTTIIKDDASIVVTNFRRVFKAAISRSTRVDIYKMPTVIGSFSSYSNQNDSGVFVLQLLLSYNGLTHFNFKQEHAEPIRQSITYYLCTHEENMVVMPDIKKIAYQHGIILGKQQANC